MASQMAALNASFAGAKVTKAAKKVRVSARAMKPVRAAVRPLPTCPRTPSRTASTPFASSRLMPSTSLTPATPVFPWLRPMGYVIYREAMTHNPKDHTWFNRDRFVLSAGHGCMLQYSLMHLTGYPSVP